MPEKEKHDRHRIVVEEVESPLEVIDENKKVSSSELASEENIQLAEEKPEKTSEELSENKIENNTTDSTVDIKPEVDIPIPQNLESQRVKQMSPVFWILIPGIFILGAILGGLIFYQRGTNNVSVSESPIATASPTTNATPVPTSTPDVDISKLEIAVFNGSGTAGEAGKVKTLLEEAGFTVASTGNAATYDYTDTIIKVKSEIDDSVIQKIEDALKDDYSVGDNETLSASATTDIQVVVGSTKAK